MKPLFNIKKLFILTAYTPEFYQITCCWTFCVYTSPYHTYLYWSQALVLAEFS